MALDGSISERLYQMEQTSPADVPKITGREDLPLRHHLGLPQWTFGVFDFR